MSTTKRALSQVFRYFIDLNTVHSKLHREKEKSVDGDANGALDDIMYYKDKLINWTVSGPFWSMTGILLPVVAHACPAGSIYATAVWKFFNALTWRHPDLPLDKKDFGITWCELALQFTIFAGKCLPVWIHDHDKGYCVPFDFHSDKVALQKPDFRGLGHQTSAFRAIVRYLENTSGHRLFPRYKKTGASSLFRLGFHRSLIGGVAARPILPQNALSYAVLDAYMSTPGQSYPLNVRVPFQPQLDHAMIQHSDHEHLTFEKRHNLYQRVKKCIRLKQNLADLAWAT